ncbi:MAG: Na+/H+ antiporter subunit E [Flavobacterium sp.]|nr:Na+/H+ antiporter subunit E [Flavobacterium sp.]
MVKQFLMNMLLSFIWVALTGQMYFTNFLFGFILGFFILWVMNRGAADRRYFTRIPNAIYFAFYFLYQMLNSNLQVAFDVITPRYFFTPGVIAYKMTAKTPLEINLLSTALSLTPGTMVLDISEDNTILYLHVMYLKDKREFTQQIQNGLERKLLELLR